MTENDIVICIDNSSKLKYHETINETALTINKTYKVICNYSYKGVNKFLSKLSIYNTIIIENDNQVRAEYRTERFVDIQQWREMQIKKILNEK
jgi:hypothetical protein